MLYWLASVFKKRKSYLRVMGLLALFFTGGSWLRADPVQWGGSANVAPGGWGRMIELTNGSWLAVSTVYPAGTNSYLSLLASYNDCRSWSVVSQVRVAGRTLDNGELVALPNGNLLLTMRDLVGTNSFLLPVYASANQGHTWNYLSNIDSSGGPGGLWEPHFMVLSNALLAVFYSNETHPGYNQMISEKVSSDNGTNWGPEIWAAAQEGGGNLRPGMPQSVRMSNGTYILVMEVVNLGNADVYYKLSSDGMTWTNGLGVHIPCQHAGPFVTSLTNGEVFVTSCQNEVSFSRDFGLTWRRVENPPWDMGFNFTWPALYQTAAQELASLVTWGGVNLRFGNLTPPTIWPNPLVENFNNGTDTNWTRYGGDFALANGAYLLNDTNSYGKALTGSEFWTDGTLDVDMVLSTPGNAGVVLRMTNPDYTGPDDGFDYYAGLDTGGLVVFGIQSNAWTQLATAAMPVALNTTYHLRVVMKGATFRIYANDLTTPKITYTESTWSRGQVGVRAFNCNASFDNFVFTNAAPLRLSLSATKGQYSLSWPLSPVNVKVFSAMGLPLPSLGQPVASNATLVNGQWTLTLTQSKPGGQFFWLQGE